MENISSGQTKSSERFSTVVSYSSDLEHLQKKCSSQPSDARNKSLMYSHDTWLQPCHDVFKRHRKSNLLYVISCRSGFIGGPETPSDCKRQALKWVHRNLSHNVKL